MTDNPGFKEKRASMVKQAMHYGILLGLFWMFKYAFLMLGIAFTDLFKYLFYVLNVGTFILIYIFTYRFKESDERQLKSAGQCILFTILLCFFASFFESVLMYAHYKFIDPAYFNHVKEPFMKAIDSTQRPLSIPEQDFAESKVILKNIFSLRLSYVVFKFIGNTFLGAILGVFMALVIGNRNK